MTHPTATCELCGDTGLYSPSALPCPKGCKEFDIAQRLVEYIDNPHHINPMSEAFKELIRAASTAISEAEQREKDARAKALEEAAKVAEGNYDHIGVQTKHDQCPHGKFEWEDCDQCVAAAIRALKDEVR